MQMSDYQYGAVTVLKLDGSLSQEISGRFAAYFRDHVSKSLGRVVIDATSVHFVDSSGLECLLVLSDEVGRIGHTLRICGASETVSEVMDLTGIRNRFEHFEDVASAVRSIE